MDSLLFEELHGFHAHPPCEYIGDPTGSKEPGKFSWFVAGIQNYLLVDYFFVPDMIH